MQVREQRQDLVRRVRFLIGLCAACLVIIAGAFWSVQIVQGAYYRDLAESNRLRKVPIRAPRGLIYDRVGHLLVENVPSYDLLIDRSRTPDLAASVGFLFKRHHTTADAALFVSAEDQLLAFPGATPARDLWEVNARVVNRLGSSSRMISSGRTRYPRYA